MQINFAKATNMEWTDAIKTYVNDKLDMLEKLTEEFEPAAELQVEVGKSSNHHNKGPYYFAEVNLHVPGEDFRAKEEKEDLYEAIDAVKDDLRRQIVDYKERLSDAHRAPRPDKE